MPTIDINQISARIKAGKTLNYAQRKWLKSHPQELDHEHVSPLHWAAHRGDINQVTQLVKIGVPVDIRDNQGKTPFRYAVSQGHIGIMAFLLESEADVNSQCHQGNTPLHSAVYHNKREAVEFLLKCPKLDFLLTNNTGQHAYDFGSSSSRVDQSGDAMAIGKLLAEKGIFYPRLPLQAPREVFDAAEIFHRSKAIRTLARETFRVLCSFSRMGRELVTEENRSMPFELFSRMLFWSIPKEVRQFVNKDNPDAHPYASVIEAVYSNTKLEGLKAGRGENMRQFATTLATDYPHTLRILKEVSQRNLVTERALG